MKHLPTQEFLCRFLKYCPDSGLLFWRVRDLDYNIRAAAWNTRFAGKEAFINIGALGYKAGSIGGKHFLAHRIIWKMVTGEDPFYIDHIDGDRSNNRFPNLRNVVSADNSRNRARSSRNTSGVVGVSLRKYGKWHASIAFDGKTKFLVDFPSFEEAVVARKIAEKSYGFHDNHGRN